MMSLSIRANGGLSRAKNSGFVLVTVLLLLSILSVSALIAVEQSHLSYKINHARIAHMQARQISEDGRLLGLKRLKSLLADTKQNTHMHYAKPVFDRVKKDGLKHFLSVKEPSAQVEVSLQALPTKLLKNGVSLSQHMAYSGLGNGLGSQGSYSMHYELRAHGRALDKNNYVDVWTASDFMFIPK